MHKALWGHFSAWYLELIREKYIYIYAEVYDACFRPFRIEARGRSRPVTNGSAPRGAQHNSHQLITWISMNDNKQQLHMKSNQCHLSSVFTFDHRTWNKWEDLCCSCWFQVLISHQNHFSSVCFTSCLNKKRSAAILWSAGWMWTDAIWEISLLTKTKQTKSLIQRRSSSEQSRELSHYHYHNVIKRARIKVAFLLFN